MIVATRPDPTVYGMNALSHNVIMADRKKLKSANDIPKERKDQYYDYSEMIEIDLILEEYFNAA